MSSPVCQTCLINLYRKMTDQFRPELFDDSVTWSLISSHSYSITREIHMTHCRNIHDTLQKYSWHIAKILMTYYKNTQDILQKYSWYIAKKYWWHIAEILMTHCRNTHDTLQNYSWHIAEILIAHCRNTHQTWLQKYSWYMKSRIRTCKLHREYKSDWLKISLIIFFCLRLPIEGYIFSSYFCIFCIIKFLLFPFSDFSRLFICWICLCQKLIIVEINSFAISLR